jgi:hypothetical protein
MTLNSCPEGFHKRAGYKTKTGKYVKPSCVRSTTKYKETSKEFKSGEKAKQTRRLAKLIPSIKSLSRKACPPGMIERKAYARRYSTAVLQEGFKKKTRSGRTVTVKPHKRRLTLVESKCVKDTGLPGKGTQSIGPLRKGELSKYGYTLKISELQRRKALKKAIDEFGALGVYRKLDAVAKLTSRTIPEASKQFEKDRDWVKETYGPLKAI